MKHDILPVRTGARSRWTGRLARVSRTRGLLASAALLLAGLPLAGQAQTTFSNPTAISIPRNTLTQGPADLYPSPITVSGLGSSTLNVTVTFSNLSHMYPDDIDVLLVGPSGQNVLLMSDTGGYFPVSGLNLTFSDDAGASLPDETQLVSGTFKPTNYDGPYSPYTPDSFAAPAPTTGPYGSTLSVFNGSNPNGVWNLYVLDDTQGNSGTMASGWSLTITASPIPEPSGFVLGAFGLGATGLFVARRRCLAARA